MKMMAFGNMNAKLIQVSLTLAKIKRNIAYNDKKCNAEIGSKQRR